MGKINSIICDNCGEELVVDSSYPHRFSLMLSCVDTGINTSGRQYAVMIHPLIQGDKYFCNKMCLVNWLTQKEKDVPQNTVELITTELNSLKAEIVALEEKLADAINNCSWIEVRGIGDQMRQLSAV